MFLIRIVVLVLILATISISFYSLALGYLNWWKRIAIGIATTLGFFFVFWLSRISEPGYVLMFLYFLAWIVGGTILYSTLLLPILGIVTIIGRKIKKPQIINTCAWAFLAIGAILAVVGIFQRSFIKTTTYTVATDRIELQGLRVAILADPQFNIANNNQTARHITRHITKLGPDVILIPGDMFDGATLKWDVLKQEFKKWSAVAPIFMAPGNHEEYGDYATFMKLVRDNGIITLEDQVTDWNGITIAGFKYYGPNDQEQGSTTIAQTIESTDPEKPLFIINHEPRYMDLFAKQGADLVVYGHTHAGQFWPVKYIMQWVYGDYWYGKNIIGNTTLVTSSGLGLTMFPSRLFNTPEIVVIKFTKK